MLTPIRSVSLHSFSFRLLLWSVPPSETLILDALLIDHPQFSPRLIDHLFSFFPSLFSASFPGTKWVVQTLKMELSLIVTLHRSQIRSLTMSPPLEVANVIYHQHLLINSVEAWPLLLSAPRWLPWDLCNSVSVWVLSLTYCFIN